MISFNGSTFINKYKTTVNYYFIVGTLDANKAKSLNFRTLKR